MSENEPVSQAIEIVELTVVSYAVLEIIFMYTVSLDVIIPVVPIAVQLFIKRTHFDMLMRADPESPKTRIGSDLYVVSRFTFLSQIVGLTIKAPVSVLTQYADEVVKLMIFELAELFTASVAFILI